MLIKKHLVEDRRLTDRTEKLTKVVDSTNSLREGLDG